ncbi:MAG: FG-GAP-like repeat-containing protein [bacterium]
MSGHKNGPPASGIRPGTLVATFFVLSAMPASADFRDVSAAAGVQLTEFTYGMAWNDFDGDGRRDLLTCRHFSPPVIYRGLANGTFSSTFTPPLFGPGDHHGPVVFDFDNDGDADIYLTGGAEGGAGSLAKHFYRNDGAFHFVNITEGSGLADSAGRGRSCSAMDVNGDGWVDVFVAKARRVGSPNSLYLNDGAGHFTDIAASAGIADDFGSVGGVWGDYDHDGDPDLFVSGEEDTLSQSRLYRNDGNLTFTNVTSTFLPGLGRVAAAAWGDFDKDGDLDLAVGLGDEALFDGAERSGDKITFFCNARENENGVDGIDFTTSASSVSFDLYSLGYYDPTTIFIGASGAHPGSVSPFTLTSAQAAGQPPYTVGTSVGIYIWAQGTSWKIRCCSLPNEGFNYGGLIDATASITSMTTSNFEPYTHGPRGTRLYRNDGSTFHDVTAQFNIHDSVNVRNLTWVDYDHDEDLDLHVLAKGDTQAQNEPDVIYRNRTTYFTDETANLNLAGPSNGLADACAWEDYDGDGDLDVAMLSGGPPRAYALLETDRLYRNDSSSRYYLRVNLVGTASNRDGLGAWVTCVSSFAGPQYQYVTGNAWRGGQVMTDAYFGLRFSTAVERLRVDWPSGAVSELWNVPLGESTVVEDARGLDASTIAADPSRRLRLSARPTPAAGSVAFDVVGARGAPGTFEIFDAAGRRVLQRGLGATPARIDWAGTNASGRRVASGVYYAVLREAGREARAKVVMLRQ